MTTSRRRPRRHRQPNRWKNASVAASQKPLELILARNLLTSISTPAFLLDENSHLVFYNESAGALLGISFEETGRMDPQEWTGSFGPVRRGRQPDLDRRSWTSPARSVDGRPAHSRFCIRSAKGERARDRGGGLPHHRLRAGRLGRDDLLLAARGERGRRVKVKVWGARGSVPAPGPQMNRYGGNTSCVQVTLDGGEELILDAGTGIRNLGLNLLNDPKVNILLTHLHLDHIQGLMFFPPCFQEESSITIWGPGLARGLARGPDRPLHLGAALAGRGPRAALRRLVPRHARPPSGRSARPRCGPRLSPTAGRRWATGSPRATRPSVTSPTTSRRWVRRSRISTPSGSRASTSPARPTS